MANERTRSVRKATGGRYHPYRKARDFAKVFDPILTKIGERKVFEKRSRGGATKFKLTSVNIINVAIPKQKKVVKATITDVADNKSNRNFIIRDIMNKGAIVQTSVGKVKITSRPGQVGTLSGILVE
jgi:small subunit ribosomal protein S8e